MEPEHQQRERTTAHPPARLGAWGPLQWASEPRAVGSDESLRGAACGGALGWGLAVLSGVSGPGRLLCLAAGALAGNLAARHRVYLSWNPDPAPTPWAPGPIVELPRPEGEARA